MYANSTFLYSYWWAQECCERLGCDLPAEGGHRIPGLACNQTFGFSESTFVHNSVKDVILVFHRRRHHPLSQSTYLNWGFCGFVSRPRIPPTRSFVNARGGGGCFAYLAIGEIIFVRVIKSLHDSCSVTLLVVPDAYEAVHHC